jgi:hypothetical protein
MDKTDWIIVLVGGVVGWGLVSLIAKLAQQQRQPPVDLYGGLPRQAEPPARAVLSVAEIGNLWHKILNVPEDASAKEIEEAYHLRIAECDRIRFSPTETPDQQKMAAIKRTQVNQAYEFIRPLRKPV